MKLKPSYENFPEDVTRIQAAIRNHGYECSRKQADEIWREYSASVCAGWLILPVADETLWRCVEEFIEVDDYDGA